MPDPLGAQLPQRVPDRLRPGGLPGVRHRAQPGRAGLVEVRLELRPGYADLRAAQTEADQPVRPLLERDPQRLLGRRQAGLARDVEAPAQLDAEIGLGRARASSIASQNAGAGIPRGHASRA